MRPHGKVRVVAVAVSTASDVVEQIKGVSSMWRVFNDDYLYLYSLSKQPKTLSLLRLLSRRESCKFSIFC